MSTYVDIVDTIMDRFATEWGTSTKIIFEESNREEVKIGSNENWVRLAIIPFNSMSASSGIGDGGLNRHKGMISIQVYVPESSGTITHRSLIDQALAVFDRQSFSVIRCGVSHVSKPARDGGWYFKTVSTPYQGDIFST